MHKAASNLLKHGVSFKNAAKIFANEILERVDDREDYGEIRIIALGRVLYRVVYTRRNKTTIRIISAQKAGKNEQEIYYRKILSQ
ncbi:BrnT family toxin [Phyllobacterium sp. YR531]|uniref:BrnT family toxin n=1 Tax=Phyllobacterium sp. YR531 TaxID=1144343 RepID=UPI001FCA5344|nr:BrnT family toxin [Phyllobacterium sp. YR531]